MTRASRRGRGGHAGSRAARPDLYHANCVSSNWQRSAGRNTRSRRTWGSAKPRCRKPQTCRTPIAPRTVGDRGPPEGPANGAARAPVRGSDAGLDGEQGGQHPPTPAESARAAPPTNIAELTVENSHGDPRYLGEARQALADARKLWGLDAPQRVDLRASQNPYDGMTEDDLRAGAGAAGASADTHRAVPSPRAHPAPAEVVTTSEETDHGE